MSEPAATPVPLARALLAAAALGLLGFLVLYAAGPSPLVHIDTARDVLMSRDCLELQRCHQSGPPTSYEGLAQGTSWIRALELSRSLGLSLRATHGCFLALFSLLAALLSLLHSRLLATRGGALTGLCFLLGVVLTAGYPMLWNPTLQVVPVTLWFTLLVAGALHRNDVALAASSGLLALSLDGHPIALVLLAPTLAVGAGFARRAWLVLALSPLCFAAVSLSVSPRFFSLNAAVFAHFRGLLALIAAGAVAAGLLLRGWVARSSYTRRVAALVHGVALASFAGSLVLVRWIGHYFTLRYFVPAVPALAASAGLLCAQGLALAAARTRAPAWVSRAALALVTAALALGSARYAWRLGHQRESWSWSEVETMRQRFAAQGYDFDALFRRLRGQDSYDLLIALAALDPQVGHRRTDHGAAAPEDDLAFARVGAGSLPATLPPGWQLAPLENGETALFGRVRSVLDSGELELCALTAPARPEQSLCALVPVSTMQLGNPVPLGMTRFAYFTVAGIQRFVARVALSPLRYTRLRYRVRGTLTPQSPARRFAVTQAERSPWRVVRVEGAVADRPLPASALLVSSPGLEPAPFALELESALESNALQAHLYWPPPLLEVLSEQESVLRVLRGAR